MQPQEAVLAFYQRMLRVGSNQPALFQAVESWHIDLCLA